MFKPPHFVAGTALAVGLAVAGCAGNSPPQSTLALSPQGITCTKCQVIWVEAPRYSSRYNRIIGYSREPVHVCPDCVDAVASFFSTGKFQHTCKTCGDTMEICRAHEF